LYTAFRTTEILGFVHCVTSQTHK